MKSRILVADDDSGVLSAVTMLFRSQGIDSVSVDSPSQTLLAVREGCFDLVLMDLNFTLDTTSGEEGLNLINQIRLQEEFLPIVVMTGWGTIEVAVQALKNGAAEFIEKPWENERLLSVIDNQLRLAKLEVGSNKLRHQNQLLRDEINPINHIVRESSAIRKTIETIERVARSDASVLLTGENGTGKSMFARYLHEKSTRNSSGMIGVNMGAIAESLFESEMFGHVKGAFTDAKSTQIGRFELADEGTLFLDEIANITLAQQNKLLRVLEDWQFEKVGSRKTQTVDFRLISATNSDIKKAVRDGKFREDLMYRINTVEIEIPPLRQRTEDIIPLANTFLDNAATKYSDRKLEIDDDAMSLLKAYEWPGNVRELAHLMEKLQILCKSTRIRAQDLGLDATVPTIANQEPDNSAQHDLRPIHEIEQSIIEDRLVYYDGDASKAAVSLGWSRSAFYRRLGKLKAES